VISGLGIPDYGIFDVVAGLITTLMSLSSVLSSSTQRYYAICLGENKDGYFSTIFSASLTIHIILSVLVVLLGETVGLWMLKTQLVIPEDRMVAASWVYQLSILSFVLTFLHIPYSAAIIAHENMKVFAAISIIESLLKLVAALLLFVAKTEKLVFYGLSLFLISGFVFSFYIFFSKRNYKNQLLFNLPDTKTIKQLLSFSGWSLFGSTASVGIGQVVTILTNVFFGPLVNSARAIALQFNLVVTSFTASFLMALRPPMIKSYAEGSYSVLDNIFYLSNKIIYYSLLIFCLPVFFEMQTVLSFWLNVNDDQVVLFSRLMLIYAVIMALNNPISIIIQAVGRVKEYHVAVEFFMLLVVPITYLFFELDFPAYSTYIVLIVASFLAHIIRLVSLKKFYSSYTHSVYIKSFVLPALLITVLSGIAVYFINKVLFGSLFYFLLLVIFTMMVVLVLVYLLNISIEEKKVIRNYLYAKLLKKTENDR
jgi:O-antigen/teichoic acid export membrane protein